MRRLVKSYRSSRVARAIAEHPWSSLQDFVLLSSGMIVAVVLALEYDLFRYGEQLSPEERKITLGELIFLSGLLAAGVVGFVLRRLQESRNLIVDKARYSYDMERLKEQTLRDPLTGALNRRGLLEALAAATAGQDPGRSKHAFFVIDLDGFKRVNDLHGHTVGDEVLKAAVDRTRTAARPGDVLGRLDGGDEFALLACEVSRQRAEALAERIVDAFARDIVVEGCQAKLDVSIGAVTLPDQGMTGGEIITKADLAMYRAKEDGLPAVVFFDDGAAGPTRAP
jgi:diguanylate cyclase (GGDEF)-like protein